MTATKFTKVYHFKCLPIETLLRHSRRGRCVYMWTSATGLWAKIPFGHKPQSSHLLTECKLSLFLGRSYTPAFLLPWVCSLVPRSLYSWSAVWLAGAPTHPGCEQGVSPSRLTGPAGCPSCQQVFFVPVAHRTMLGPNCARLPRGRCQS